VREQPKELMPDLSRDLARARSREQSRFQLPRERLHRLVQRLRTGPPSPSRLAASRLERIREFVQAQEERRLLAQARAGRDICWADDQDSEPLVTVRIATYNRGPLIAERAIQSVLGQTYRNLEVLVVGDACDDATAAAVRAVDDKRVRFINLPTRGLYPEDQQGRWMVAGTHPMNVALSLARGSWIAPCDDDDQFTPTHVERLLEHALRHRLEMVWSRAGLRQPNDGWTVTLGPPLRYGQISHGSVIYSLGLRFFQHSNTAWRLPEPGDWNLWRRMRGAGVRIGFLDEITYLHY
jgi:hypothetical protein